MMRLFFSALSFLTRLPIPAGYVFNGEDVGKSTVAFPAVGLLLGLLHVVLLWVLQQVFPVMLCAALLLVFSALVTGALHLDAIADMADGFGGGRTKEDILRIMRDHVIGAYGAVALLLDFAVKFSALCYLIEHDAATVSLLVAPMLGRWASVYLGFSSPYARAQGGLGAAITDYMGPRELLGATLFVMFWVGVLVGGKGVFWLGVVFWFTRQFGAYCKKHIGGITGDTMGANTECVELLVYLFGVALLGGVTQ